VSCCEEGVLFVVRGVVRRERVLFVVSGVVLWRRDCCYLCCEEG